MTENHDSIQVGSGMRAFAIGVNAGTDALLKLEDMGTSTHGERVAYYWLACGTVLATKLPDANEDDQLQFLAGAASRAPIGPPVSVYLDRIEGAAFGEDDEDQRLNEVARLIHEAADKIANGGTEGKLYDLNGAAAGKYSYSPF